MLNFYLIMRVKKIPLLVENKYGVCSILANNIMKGSVASIQNALNKTEYFINQYEDFFKNKLDFSNILKDLTITTEQLKYDTDFEPTEEELEMLDDLATRVFNICINDN